jgi:hypothetical protein
MLRAAPALDSAEFDRVRLRRMLWRYFILAFGITWGAGGLGLLIWLALPDTPFTASNPLYFLAAYGPSIAAILVGLHFEGRPWLVARLRAFVPKVHHIGWYVLVLLGGPLLTTSSEDQLDAAVNQLVHRFGVEADVSNIHIAYKETVTRAAEGESEYATQSGGRRQYAHVKIRVEPGEPGSGCVFKFENAILGDAIPERMIPSVEEGIAEAIDRGVLAGLLVASIELEPVVVRSRHQPSAGGANRPRRKTLERHQNLSMSRDDFFALPLGDRLENVAHRPRGIDRKPRRDWIL